MAAGFDNKFEDASNSSVTSCSVIGTVVSNANGVLICCLDWQGFVSGVTATWDSGGTNQAMTAIGSVTQFGAYYSALFGLLNPIAGTKTLAAAWSTAQAWVIGGLSFIDATGWSDFTTATATSQATTITVPNVLANDAVAGNQLDDNATSTTIVTGVKDWDERRFTGNYAGLHNIGNGTVATSLGGGVDKLWGILGARIIGTGAAGGLPLMGAMML